MSLIIKNNSHPSSFPKFENHLISKRIILKRAPPKSKTLSLLPWQKASIVSALVLASCAAIRLAFSNETPPVHSPMKSIIPQQITAQQTHDVFFNNITLLSANQTSLVETAIKDRECDDLPLPIRLIKRLDQEERIDNPIINKEVASQKEVKEAATQKEVASQKEVEAVTSQKEVASQPESTWLKLLPLDKYICPLNATNFSHPLESSPNKKAEEKEAEEMPVKKIEEIHVVEAVSHDDPIELVPIENKIENKLENKHLSPDAINNPDQAASKYPASESSIFSYMPYMAGAVCLMFLVAGKICKLCRSNKKEPIPSPIQIPVVQPLQQEEKSVSLPPTDLKAPPQQEITDGLLSLQSFPKIVITPPSRRSSVDAGTQTSAQPKLDGQPNAVKNGQKNAVTTVDTLSPRQKLSFATPSHPGAPLVPSTPFTESELNAAKVETTVPSGPSKSGKRRARKNTLVFSLASPLVASPPSRQNGSRKVSPQQKSGSRSLPPDPSANRSRSQDLVSLPVIPQQASNHSHEKTNPHGVKPHDLQQGHERLKPLTVKAPPNTASRSVRNRMQNMRISIEKGGDEVGDGGDEDDSDDGVSPGPASPPPMPPRQQFTRWSATATPVMPARRQDQPVPTLELRSVDQQFVTPVMKKHANKQNPKSSGGGFTPPSS